MRNLPRRILMRQLQRPGSRKVRFILLVCLFLVVSTAKSPAQTSHITFSEISIEEGLSQSIVSCLIQDSTGFMWFGTEDGLNRYDGYRISVLRHDPREANSLVYNEILSILEDRSGILWIGTFHGGLDRYDPVARQFTHYRNDPDDPNSISHNIVRSIYEDSAGMLWIGTDRGLNRLDPETGTFTRYLHDPNLPASLSNDTVLTIVEDGSRAIWIGTDGGGLERYDPQQDAFIHYRADHDDSKGLAHDTVRSLCEDRDGVLWVGTDRGLARLDEERSVLTRYVNDPDDPHSLSDDQIYAIYESRSGVLWIGTDGGGLNRFDRASGEFTRYINDPNDDTSITYNQIRAIYEDRAGVMWIGTYGGGVNKFDSKQKQFLLFKPIVNEPNSLSHDIIWAIYEDDAGYLWIGTHGGGLDRLDRRTKQYVHFRHDPADPSSLSHDIVRVICEDRSGLIWLGTHGGGVCSFDRSTEKFTTYRHDPLDPGSLSHDEIRSIYEDRSGIIWIGTNGGGLDRFDRESRSFEHFCNDTNNPHSLSNDFVRVIYEDSRGIFWIGTQGGGLNRFDREKETFTSYQTDTDDPNSISNDFIFSIHEDKSGALWLGTWGGGLNRFAVEHGTFTCYTTEDGLASDAIYGILEDDRGHLWMSTNNGLSRYDPHAQTFRNYSEEDGLQSNEFNGGSFYQSKSGEMFFGGIHGFNAFYAENLKDNPYIPQIVIISFLKLNKEVELDKPISDVEELTLSHRDFTFSFEFAALDYTVPRKNQYAYKMVGLHDDWITTGSDKRSATFTTLAPGRYTFMVKGSNNDGVWNEKGTAIVITITPPFWKTWWFRTLAIAVAACLVLLLYRWRLKNVRMTAELKSAHDAQMSIMPQADPQIDDYDISGICIPTNEVGGDFYDVFWQDRARARLGVFVGDVSGKAMQAAMIAVMSSGMVYSRADGTTSPGKILTCLNGPLYKKTSDEMFTALCFASINISTKEFTYALAGISEPLLKSGENVGGIATAKLGLPLGAFGDSSYDEDTIRLKAGDVILLFTDGIIEAQNKAGEFYDEIRLERLVARLPTADLSASEIKDRILDDVNKFIGSAVQQDDITLVIIKAL